MSKRASHSAVFLAASSIAIAVLVIAGCSTSSQVAMQSVVPQRVPLSAASTLENVRLFTRPSTQVTAAGEIDFGAVPAGRFADHMKFMSGTYLRSLLVGNQRTEPLAITSVEVRGVRSDEPVTPFSLCGVEFKPYNLAPGKALEIHICFHPTQEGSSSAIFTVRGPDGGVLVSTTAHGRGRRLAPGEEPPMGLIPPQGHLDAMDLGLKGHVLLKAGSLIDAGSGKDITPPAPRGEGERPVERREPNCTVSITGGGEIPNPAVRATSGTAAINTGNLGLNQGVKGDEINVAQHVILDVLIICPDGTRPQPTSVLWTINGNAIKDYDETLRNATVTTTAFVPADLTARPRDLYWRDTGTHRVQCRVNFTWNGQPITVIVVRDFIVERNATNINRQMEDFYVWNHEARVLKTHFQWHLTNHSGTCWSDGGEDFFIFHRQVLGSANGFRDTFGYGSIVYWDGTQALPVSPDSLHAARGVNGVPFATPTYYTFTGNEVSPCARVEKLSEFPSGTALAREMEAAWHAQGHGHVGGDMNGLNTSPKDPIFYRWHRAIDIVYYNWQHPHPPP